MPVLVWIAIGVGGLSLRVDARTGEVEELRLIGRNLSPSKAINGNPSDEHAIDAEPTTPKKPKTPKKKTKIK